MNGAGDDPLRDGLQMRDTANGMDEGGTSGMIGLLYLGIWAFAPTGFGSFCQAF